MPRTLKELESRLWKRPGRTPGVIPAFWPYGHDALGRPYFDLEAEVLEGWVHKEGPEIVFDLDASNSRATVEGPEVVISRD